MDGSIAPSDAVRARGAGAESVASEKAYGLSYRAASPHRSAATGKPATLVSTLQVGLLVVAIISGDLFRKEIQTLTPADYVNGMLLVCGLAILSSYWSRDDSIATGAAVGALLERAAHVALLVLAATFISTRIGQATWEYLTPTRTFVWLYSLAVAGVAVAVVTGWITRSAEVRRIAVFGEGDAAAQFAHHLRSDMAGTDVCLIPSRSLTLRSERGRTEPHYTDPKLVELAPDVAIISTASGDARSAAKLVDHLAPLAVDVLLQMPHGISSGAGPMLTFGGMPFIRVFPKPLMTYQAALKRAFDIVVSATILIALLPLLAAVAFAIKVDSRGPILFKQPRIGRGGAHFTVLKFRTMRDDAGDVLADKLTERHDPRLTGIGGFLRKTSIDELPQLLNVMFGSMSLVGPRPHALNAKANGALYRDVVPNYDARHRVKPGITGLAQILGWRGPTDTYAQIEQRVANDLRYISDWSFFLDLAIIVRTAFALFGKNAL